MYCRNCGKELQENEKYCNECGARVSRFGKPVNRKKHIITLLFSVIGSLLLIGVLIFIIVILNHPNNNMISDDKESDSSKSITASPFTWVIDRFYSDHQIATIGETINLKYKYVDGNKYYDCSEYKNTVLDVLVDDYNNDGLEDVTVISLDVNEKGYIREDGYGSIYVYIKTYMSTDHFTYELYDQLSDEIMFWVKDDHIEEDIYYSIETTTDDSKALLLYTQQINDSELYDESKRYYSKEESLGDYSESIQLYSFINSGFQFRFRTTRSISHISGMPEAENTRYSLLEDGKKERALYVDGRYVITGSDIVTPQIKSFKEGDCETDEEACNVINKLFDQYGLSSYNAVPLKWNSRYDDSILPKANQTCVLHATVVTGDEESGEHQIQIKTANKK